MAAFAAEEYADAVRLLTDAISESKRVDARVSSCDKASRTESHAYWQASILPVGSSTRPAAPRTTAPEHTPRPSEISNTR